jgi:methyltransferase
LIELRVSRRNQQRMAARGAQMVRDMSFVWMVLWHGGVLLGAAAEVVLLSRGFHPALATVAGAVFVFSNLLRWWVICTLATHWNVQVMNSASLGVITSGPYRWIRHPNYVAVFLEVTALPLIHTAWITSLAAAVSTVLILIRRIGVEESVLNSSAEYRAAMSSKPRFVPGLF